MSYINLVKFAVTIISDVILVSAVVVPCSHSDVLITHTSMLNSVLLFTVLLLPLQL